MKSDRDQERKRERRWWLILLLILLLGILAMCCAGQMALGMNPAWSVPAGMDSNIDPDEKYATAFGTAVIFEPIEGDILTQPSWADDILTPSTSTPTFDPNNPPTSVTSTPQLTGTATLPVTGTATLPVTTTATLPITETATPLPTSTVFIPPVGTNTNTPNPPIPTGTIIIVKDSQPDNAQNFTFSGGLGTFLLDDDADATLPNTRTFTGLAVGNYNVTEAVIAGWNVTGLVCVDPDGGTTVNLGTRTATINLDAGETITCTFTNQQTGSITIIKDSQPNNAQDFTYSGGLGAFSLDDDADATLPNTLLFNGLIAGTYTVTENAVAGWSLTGLVCVDPDLGTIVNVGTLTATIDLDANENIVCTFTNQRTGSITITKDSVPDSAQNFAYTGTLGAFNLVDDGTPTSTQTFTGLLAGTYTVTETAVAGWDLNGLTCIDPDGGTTVNVGTLTATIDLDAGENITCTFTNWRRGTITIIQDSAPDAAQDFVFTGSGTIGSFTLDDDLDATFSNTQVLFGMPVGIYTISQAAVGGWGLTAIVCTDPSGGTSGNFGTGVATVDVAPGDNITCTFYDTSYINIEFGLPDGDFDEIAAGTSVVLALTTPIRGHGNSAYDFVYYERASAPGIQMDNVIIYISPDGIGWTPVFNWGDGPEDPNTTLTGLGYFPESDNFGINAVDLIGGTGIGIDIFSMGLSGNYWYILIYSPFGGADAGCDVNSINIVP